MCMLVGLMVWPHKAAKQESVCMCVCVYVRMYQVAGGQ